MTTNAPRKRPSKEWIEKQREVPAPPPPPPAYKSICQYYNSCISYFKSSKK